MKKVLDWHPEVLMVLLQIREQTLLLSSESYSLRKSHGFS